MSLYLNDIILFRTYYETQNTITGGIYVVIKNILLDMGTYSKILLSSKMYTRVIWHFYSNIKNIYIYKRIYKSIFHNVPQQRGMFFSLNVCVLS